VMLVVIRDRDVALADLVILSVREMRELLGVRDELEDVRVVPIVEETAKWAV